MSDPFSAYAASRPADAIGGFLQAMREAWDSGAAAWQSLAGQAASGGLGGAMGARLPEALSRLAAGPEAAVTQMADLAPAMAEAWLIAGGSALRYWRALAEINARYQGSLLRAMVDRAGDRAALPPEACRVLADELRAFLREIGDAASLEARRLQAELERIDEMIARATAQASPAPDDAAATARRPHRVKE